MHLKFVAYHLEHQTLYDVLLIDPVFNHLVLKLPGEETPPRQGLYNYPDEYIYSLRNFALLWDIGWENDLAQPLYRQIYGPKVKEIPGVEIIVDEPCDL